jgi:hypothetical protein
VPVFLDIAEAKLARLEGHGRDSVAHRGPI